MDHEITTWLDSEQDYQSGLALFNQYGRNLRLFKILQVGGASGKNRSTLSYELGKLAKNLQGYIAEASVDKHPEQQDIPKDEHLNKTEPINIDQLRQEQKMIYKMLDNLHAMLPYSELQKRKNIAFQILDLDDRLKEVTLRISHFEKTGVMLPASPKELPKSVADLDTAELIQRQMNVRTYITRYKRLVADAKSLKSLSRNQDLLEKFQMELNDINKRLGK